MAGAAAGAEVDGVDEEEGESAELVDAEDEDEASVEEAEPDDSPELDVEPDLVEARLSFL